SGRSMVLAFERPTRVDHVILQEALNRGERVRGWKLEGYAWDHWHPLDEGSAIGHKCIVPVKPDGYTMLRLTVTRSDGEAVLRRFAAYDAGVAPPRTWRDTARLWADDAVGSWSGDTLSLDLSAKAATAGRYRLRLVSESGDPVELRDLALSVAGQPATQLAHYAPGRRDALFLAIPISDSPVILKARLRGAARGTVLLQRW
ncbi:MAG TPA: hypothetical protein VKP11_11690, partial [Frankiaceae bacterium]|nr:hypothetical protein [Frankiaceae bacterium]